MSSRCRPTRASSSVRWTSPMSTRSRACRRRSRSTRRRLRATRARRSDGDRDLRLPAPAVVAGGQAALPHLRAPDRRSVGRADHRPGDGARRGDAVHGARAGRARAQGRVRQDARGAARGRLRAREIDERVRMLDESIVLDKRYKHDISVVVDRLVMRHDLRKRLADSIETAVGLAEGLVEIEIVGSARRVRERRAAEAEQRRRTRPAQGSARGPAQIVPGESPKPGRCSPSPSASRAPSMDPRWWSSSRGSSRSTRRTERASAARGSAPRWR